ncbi:MAG: hypothetical protein U5N86_01890 [Planctomycetota bacterium]|nr:hypothetical protein [Planctomycetota bacterium]
MKYILPLAFLLALMPCVPSANAEENLAFKVQCEGKSEWDREARTFELNEGVKLTYGDMVMTCEWLLVFMDESNRRPLSLSAKGYSKNAGPEEVAKGRLEFKWGRYALRCRQVEAELPSDRQHSDEGDRL